MLKTLIIDDSAEIRIRLSNLLSELGDIEMVAEAENAIKGLEMVTLHKPDLVILDIRMPDFSGLEILEKIKSNYPVPCVAILTNYPYPSYRKCCMELGADYFFDKSLEFNKVKHIIENLRVNHI